jgi:hypothetical protein
VFSDGGRARLGRTPWTQTVARGSAPVAFIVRLAGYRQSRIAFATQRDAKKSIALRRVSAAPTPAVSGADAEDGPSALKSADDPATKSADKGSDGAPPPPKSDDADE